MTGSQTLAADGGHPLNVLIIEDEAIVAMALEDMLEDMGHRVADVCGDVASALSRISNESDQITFAVLDANLDGLASLPVAEALRLKSVPFIIASGYDPAELSSTGFVEPVVKKPYTEAALIAAFATALEQAAAAR